MKGRAFCDDCYMHEEVITKDDSVAEELQHSFTLMFDRLLQEVNKTNTKEYERTGKQ